MSKSTSTKQEEQADDHPSASDARNVAAEVRDLGYDALANWLSEQADELPGEDGDV